MDIYAWKPHNLDHLEQFVCVIFTFSYLNLALIKYPDQT